MGKSGKRERLSFRKNKKPDSVESGLAVVFSGVFQPCRAFIAPDHRRQADPCQRARLPAVILTEVAAATTRTEEIMDGRDGRARRAAQAVF